MFPNRFNAYLHDTPGTHLFQRQQRAFSHGCVRIEDPAALAAFLLQDQPAWDAEKIQQATRADSPCTVNLNKRVPVHIVYWTAWADEEGALHFRPDIYGYDEKLAAALDLKALEMPGARSHPIRIELRHCGIILKLPFYWLRARSFFARPPVGIIPDWHLNCLFFLSKGGPIMKAWQEIFRNGNEGKAIQTWFLEGRQWQLTDQDRTFLRFCSIRLEEKSEVDLNRRDS